MLCAILNYAGVPWYDELMQISMGPRVLQVALYIGLLFVMPIIATGIWFILSLIFTEAQPWILVLAVTTAVGLITLAIEVSTRTDTTAMAIREAEMAVAKEQFEYLYDRSPVPYLTIDKAGNIIISNLAALRLFKSTTEGLKGQNFLSRLVAEEGMDMDLLVGKLNSGVSVTDLEAKIQSYDGTQYWVMLSIFVYGARKERLVALVDITHQKTVDLAKSEFVALASHQLRTPIAAVRWNTELLKVGLKEVFTDDQKVYFQKIERNVMRMINLINDFLSVSKLETGTFATQLADINVPEFFNSVIDEHNPMIVQKRITIDTSYEPQELSFKADTRLFHIIVNNIFSNAAKYTREDGRVAIGYEVQGPMIVITVSDTGIGIPNGEVEKLFTKFYRATNAQTHRAEGTGLGLYIVKQSVEMMGGTVQVTSEENVGTTFVVQIPRSQG